MKAFAKRFLLSSAFLCLLAGGCAGGSFSSPKESNMQILTIGTADSGGTMYPAGKALAQAISDSNGLIKINLSASNGSASNVRALMRGEVDLGLVSGDIAFAAVNGRDEFEKEPAEKLRAIAAVYPSLSNWLVLSEEDIEWVHELKGANIGIGPADSTTAFTAMLALGKLGIDADNASLTNCGLGTGADGVRDKKLTAVHGFAGIPIASFAALADDTPCRILTYTDEELRSIIREGSFYYRDVIPAGTYEGQTEPVPTFGIKCLLCVSADMDEELVYTLTSILYEKAPELKGLHGALAAMERKDFLYTELPIGLHAGAERFYREQGLLEHTD
ncbi:MAG: TAXI family TRAP transporter solute-binding subunit [Lachnospiraceae bacterium]|nr:TAXI family TRAP transporter solute-binding subunit [Lachnospiraceae bacterium]